MSGVPEPWASILSLIVGPYGVVIVEAVVIYFLYKLFREAMETARVAQDNVAKMTNAVKTLVVGVGEYRESQGRFIERWEAYQVGIREFVAEARQFIKSQT